MLNIGKWIKYLALLIALTVLFFFFVPMITAETVIFVYLFGLIAYTIFTMKLRRKKYVWQYKNAIKGIRIFLASFTFYIIFDLGLGGWAIPMDSVPVLTNELMVSADYVVYSFYAGFGFPPEVTYFFTYPFTITVLLIIAIELLKGVVEDEC